MVRRVHYMNEISIIKRVGEYNPVKWRETADLDREYLQHRHLYVGIEMYGKNDHNRPESLQKTFDGSKNTKQRFTVVFTAMSC
mmetsp:Transcript_83973/g.224655  ORF Transcript_83973/g.224655 Transcript_83973/m.224655 type:complete len:83 (+) Transcript_83973:1285-1533(+)